MVNLLVYINPSKDFDEEGTTAIKIQIDNSLELGWKPEDIMLVTNFKYEYGGVKSLDIDDKNYCPFCPSASKINAFIDLIERKIIEIGKIYWFHDIDAYQLVKIKESELGIGGADILLPDFGRMHRWSTGSMFFKDSALDIFKWTKDIVYKYKTDEERALWILTGNNMRVRSKSGHIVKGYTPKDISGVANINSRIKKANISYNFHSFNVRSNYKAAIKPLRVAHFHFTQRPINPINNVTPNKLDFFLRGKNKINVQIVPRRLVNIFNNYNIS